MASDVSRSVYRALEALGSGGGRPSPPGSTCNVNRGRCRRLHLGGHVELDLSPQAGGQNVAGRGGTPWTNARWDANPSNPKATEDDRRNYHFFEALTEAGFSGDPVMWNENRTRVIIRLPSEAVPVLSRALGGGATDARRQPSEPRRGAGVSEASRRRAEPTEPAPEAVSVSPVRAARGESVRNGAGLADERAKRHKLQIDLELSEDELRELVRRADVRAVSIDAVVAEEMRRALRRSMRGDTPGAS